jgi:NAD(P)-dependent dehydrogenase (short-subunit alcohol dehydrogenase family)
MHESRTNVLITGAGRGLGLALATEYAQQGHTVVALVRSQESVTHVSGILNVIPVIGDVTKVESLDTLSKTLTNLGTLDTLINNAGIPGSAYQLKNITSTEVENLLRVHCLGPLQVTRIALPFLKQSSRPVIVNISSRLASLDNNAAGAFAGRGFSYSYRIAKAAQNMLSQCLSQEFSADNIKTWAIHPGRLQTRSGSSNASINPEDAARKLVQLIEERNLPNGIFYSLEDGQLPW